MKPIVDDKLMERVCRLSELEISREQREAAKKDLARMLDYIDQLEKVDVSSVSPLYHVLPGENVFREDEMLGSREWDEKWLLENAPAMRDGCFVVPRTIGEA